MKYEFTGVTKDYFGVTLKQIRALVTIAGVVTAGDVGGWVESEKNLSQVSGDAWVSGDAQVSGDGSGVWRRLRCLATALFFGPPMSEQKTAL